MDYSCPGNGLFDKICDKIKYLIMEKVVLQVVLIIILEKLELIHIIIYQLNLFYTDFHNAIILIMSVVNKNKNVYCYNIFLEKGSYKDKCNKRYFK